MFMNSRLKEKDSINSLIKEHHIKLEGTVNTRDLGGYKTNDGLRTKKGVFYRSDSLGKLSETDFKYLVNNLDLKKAIDLRSLSESDLDPSPFANSKSVKYIQIPIPFSPTINNSDSYILDLYIHILEDYKYEISRVFSELSTNSPMIVSCSGGKDRTGIISALLLGMVGVEYESIVNDYLMSRYLLKEKFDVYARKIRDGLLSIPLYGLECKRDTITKMICYLQENYHSIKNYLFDCGISYEDYQKIVKLYLVTDEQLLSITVPSNNDKD